MTGFARVCASSLLRLALAVAFAAASAKAAPSDSSLRGRILKGNTSTKTNVLVMAGGSTAADKIPWLIELLANDPQGRYEVKLAYTANAWQFWKSNLTKVTSLIGGKGSGQFDHEDEWSWIVYPEMDYSISALHLTLAAWADIGVIAPANANTLHKVRYGESDSLPSAIMRAWEWYSKPLIVAPAMNYIMAEHPVTIETMRQIESMPSQVEASPFFEKGSRVFNGNVTMTGPNVCTLSNGDVGYGCMTRPIPLKALIDDTNERHYQQFQEGERQKCMGERANYHSCNGVPDQSNLLVCSGCGGSRD